ncbi:DUF2993 domain-containing protein [Streptomyces sp. MS2A]|nr:DUF2993 domain-containing protein [Streptomyces sp. MS2A]
MMAPHEPRTPEAHGAEGQDAPTAPFEMRADGRPAIDADDRSDAPAPRREDETPTLEIPVQAPAQTSPPTRSQQYVVEGGGALFAPEQTPASDPWAGAPHPAPRRRRRRGAIIAVSSLLLLAGLAAGGWFLGESWAEGEVVRTVQQEARAALGLPDDHPVDVEVPTPVLPQYLAGALSALDIAVADVPVGGVRGDLTMHAENVAVRGESTMGDARAEVSLSPDAARQLLATSTGLPTVGLELTPPGVRVSLDPGLFDSGVDVDVDLSPSVGSGRLLLNPQAFSVGGADMSADLVRDRFGDYAEPMLSPRSVCLAAALPRAFTLTAVDVDDAGMTARFDVDGAIAENEALRGPGAC